MPHNYRIAFVGNFSIKKGSQVFADVVTTLGSQHEWHVFGYVGDTESYTQIRPLITKQVVYADYQLPQLLKKQKIDIALLLSIWPETFSRTFFELLSCQLPFIGFDQGFPHQYLPDWPGFVPYQKGAAGIVEAIESLSPADVQRLKQRLGKVDLADYQRQAQLKFELVDSFLDD